MRRLATAGALLALVVTLASCGSSSGKADAGPAPADTGGGMTADASVDAAVDANMSSPDGGTPAKLGPCLDTPTDLPRPPADQLPCDLFPPGFSL